MPTPDPHDYSTEALLHAKATECAELRELLVAPDSAVLATSHATPPSALDRSALYLEMLSPVNSSAVELPDDPALLRELRGLERRRARAGRDRVDHPVGRHDDLANACAGAIQLARAENRFVIVEELRL